ncbi:MAG: DUF5107 domain-containing protein [Runella sp.]
MIKLLTFWLPLCLFSINALAQQATVLVQNKAFKTYPFSDPNPVPRVGHIYPYFRFDGYTNLPQTKEWKFVELQNQYINVSITPQIGGKIWGAYEKNTNRPFIYFNNVVKFRDIAMRGAWTSGGIEINFGDIGHAPTVSTPVDYFTRTNSDGSVSCFVGAWDWASRTRWTVEVNVPKDKAYFTTRSRWYNASPHDQSYYHWMNAGFKASGNLEFVFPGSHFIGHSGDAYPWPKNKEGRNLNFYEQNNFGSYKSYHVLGQNTDFYGGYWHDDQLGFARYSPRHDKIGQKIWIWGLSRQGMIWEKLLTDTDGQYVELQSGRLFNQAAEESINSPFKHVAFQPYASDTWTEYWYPVTNTGGITTANPLGALHLYRTSTHLVWRFSPVSDMNGNFTIKTRTGTIFDGLVNLKTLQTYTDSIALTKDKITVSLADMTLFDENSTEAATHRPLEAPVDFDWASEYGLYLKAKDLANQRKFDEAEVWFQKCLEKNKHHVPALGELAQLKYRRGLYVEALQLANTALSVNTYDPLANYTIGLIGSTPSAKEALAVAALSPQWRAAALTELARMSIKEGTLNKAEYTIKQALEHQPTNDHAKLLQVIVLRKTNRQAEALVKIKEILHQDPLNHLARFEENLINRQFDFHQYITNELPHEDFIEMALWYRRAGLYDEALTILNRSPRQVMCRLWEAYLKYEKEQIMELNPLWPQKQFIDILASDASFVFPSRVEELDMFNTLRIRLDKNAPWQLYYYYGTLLWQMNRTREAQAQYLACGNRPDFAPFYLAKAALFKEEKNVVEDALQRAYNLAPDNWRVVRAWSNFYEQQNNVEKALEIINKFTQKSNLTYHETYIMGEQKAYLFEKVGQYKACIELLKTLHILPNEGARGAHDLFRTANIKYAINLYRQKKYKDAMQYIQQAETWPENLGSGQPYDPDNRLTQFMKTTLESKMKKKGVVLPPKPEVNKNDKPLLEDFMR